MEDQQHEDPIARLASGHSVPLSEFPVNGRRSAEVPPLKLDGDTRRILERDQVVAVELGDFLTIRHGLDRALGRMTETDPTRLAVVNALSAIEKYGVGR